ncbi:hypothetical protein GCM10022200_21690 [Microbacterium awajiense]|uniref:Alpha/beta hydrolase n=1 Tax=Microbacterium awajiense TaxID=415214 RepID=A0ABP7AR59_9MICO
MTGDDLEIRGGGAVAVDTATLHATAARFMAVSAELDEVWRTVGTAQIALMTQRVDSGSALSATALLGRDLRGAIDEASAIAEALRAAAAVYELVELRAERDAAFQAGDVAALARIDARIGDLRGDHPDAFDAARMLEVERAVMWPSELVRQATETGFVLGEEAGVRGAVIAGAVSGFGTIVFGAAAGLSRRGLVARDARLTGVGTAPATLVPVTPKSATAAPATLAAVVERMPGGTPSRVRVERYTMPDGSRQFLLYVSGTKSVGVGGAEAWDAQSNIELYTGSSSASYEATLAALRAAGAEPGDAVHAFGHSQGAMIASHLAVAGDYDTRTLVTFGSPVEADVGPGTVSVGIRHTDDAVAGLAGGGHMGSVGAPGSFVVERVSDPATGVHDVALGAHLLPAYAETAALVDASSDPRVDGIREVLAGLAEADDLAVFEFGAVRGEVSPSSGAGSTRRAS